MGRDVEERIVIFSHCWSFIVQFKGSISCKIIVLYKSQFLQFYSLTVQFTFYQFQTFIKAFVFGTLIAMNIWQILAIPFILFEYYKSIF